MNRYDFAPFSFAGNATPTDCPHCLYFSTDEEGTRCHCLRFARFVDHVLPKRTGICEYWTGRGFFDEAGREKTLSRGS